MQNTARSGDVFRSHLFAAKLHFSGNVQQRLQLGRNLGVSPVGLYFLDQCFIVSQLRSGNRSMNRLAKEAIVAPGDMRGDHLALAPRKRAFAAQQDIDQLIQGRRGLGTKRHGSENAGKLSTEFLGDWKLNISHR